jgi:hypothetical protein
VGTLIGFAHPGARYQKAVQTLRVMAERATNAYLWFVIGSKGAGSRCSARGLRRANSKGNAGGRARPTVRRTFREVRSAA